ncbi:hypothetical protein M885DRAFT_574308 [Pelagophyceae sp. CCMP2097]|nr:hypothetical protein M885DRAFT_574308 [Pelagophyceae sp. CCMP2097]
MTNAAAQAPLRDALVDLATGQLDPTEPPHGDGDGDEAMRDDDGRPGAAGAAQRTPPATADTRDVCDARAVNLRKIFAGWFEPKFRCRIGMVATFSPILTGTIKSNANPLPLGAGSGSAATTFYQNKYMSKNDFKHAASLSVLVDSYSKIKAYPSTAEDAGTASRFAKHFLQNVCNNLYKRVGAG